MLIWCKNWQQSSEEIVDFWYLQKQFNMGILAFSLLIFLPFSAKRNCLIYLFFSKFYFIFFWNLAFSEHQFCQKKLMLKLTSSFIVSAWVNVCSSLSAVVTLSVLCSVRTWQMGDVICNVQFSCDRVKFWL